MIKELNRRQVRQVEILTEYYFEIEYISGIDNTRANALNRKVELQGGKKLLDTVLRLDEDGKIRYNYPQLVGTHEVLVSSWEQQIREAKETDPDYKDYKERETKLKAMYIPGSIARKFIIEFYKGIIQGYNGATALVLRLQEEYIIRNVQSIVREVIRECLDYQRNKFNRYRPYGELQLVEVLSRLQEVISWDFIVKLPKLEDLVIG